jgi:uncharacterized OB-fold protein
MKLLVVACPKCGARKSTPFGLCPECELEQGRTRASDPGHRVREQVRVKRAA